MRTSPSIVPRDDDRIVYFVMDDLGRLGRVWREMDPDKTDRETVIRDLLDGQYSNPVRVVAFNTAEGWSRDASEDIADALRRRCELDSVSRRRASRGFWSVSPNIHATIEAVFLTQCFQWVAPMALKRKRIWTEEDDRRLLDLRKSGRLYSKIAEALNRTADAVKHRHSILRKRGDIRPFAHPSIR